MNYQKWLLNELLTKYENSKAFREGSSQRRVLYSISKDRQIANKFENIDEKSAFLFQLKNLCERNIIGYSWIKYEENNLVDQVWLNTEEKALKEAYRITERIPKEEKLNRLVLLIEEYEKKAKKEWLLQFFIRIKALAKEKKTIPRYFTEDVKLNSDILKAIHEISMIQNEVLERVFSSQVFGDSKYFERELRGKVVSILKEISKEEISKETADDEILNRYGVVKYPEVMEFCGKVSLITNDEKVVDYSTQIFGAYINSWLVEDTKQVMLNEIERVLFIENKANYISYIQHHYDEKELVIYHGGFYSPVKRLWFEKIHEAAGSEKIRFFHWSDIDYGGFQLFCRLRDNIIPELRPLYMDKQTLEKYKNQAKPIESDEYCKKLQGLLENSSYNCFFDVIEFMLENKIKLEQEILLGE